MTLLKDEQLRNRVRAASREQLVLMLYDGAILFCDRARGAIGNGDAEGSYRLLLRAQNIVLELLYDLDRKTGGEVAANLAALYTYAYNQLVEANVYKDAGRIERVVSILRSLREAWAEAIAKIEKKGGVEHE